MPRYNIDTDETKQILNRYYDVPMEELNRMDSCELSDKFHEYLDWRESCRYDQQHCMAVACTVKNVGC